MKLVHSFWSKPSLSDSSSKDRSIGGWREHKYHLMGWALSCLCAKKYYPNIELVTDNAGAKLLVDQLQLPYNSVKTELNRIKDYSPKLWALGKLIAYNIQNEPFIHIDGDVFIWERFEQKIEQAPLVVQHFDTHYEQYANGLNELKQLGFVFPSDFNHVALGKEQFRSINAGIIGGNNIEFVKRYCNRSFDLIHTNIPKLNLSFRESSYAILYEQLYFSLLAQQENARISCLLNEKENDEFVISDFMNKYSRKKYVHLINKTKSYFDHCRELEMQLLISFPKYHEKIVRFISDNYE